MGPMFIGNKLIAVMTMSMLRVRLVIRELVLAAETSYRDVSTTVAQGSPTWNSAYHSHPQRGGPAELKKKRAQMLPSQSYAMAAVNGELEYLPMLWCLINVFGNF